MHFDLKSEGRERLRSNIAAETLQPSSLSFVLVRTGEQQEEQEEVGSGTAGGEAGVARAEGGRQALPRWEGALGLEGQADELEFSAF